eukprot:COSAG01_NODE_48_length_31904_cov_21.696997_15_plen_78_part_00
MAVMAAMTGLCIYNSLNPGSEDVGEGESRRKNKAREAQEKAAHEKKYGSTGLGRPLTSYERDLYAEGKGSVRGKTGH